MKVKTLFISILILVFTLCSCSNQKITKVDMSTISSAKKVDMSGYQNMPAFDHQFLAIDINDFKDIFENKKSAIIYLGYKKCHICQIATQYLNEVAKEKNQIIYYYNVADETFGLKNKDNAKLVYGYLDSVLDSSNGQKAIFTPHAISVVNGKIVADHLGLSKTNPWSTNDSKNDKAKQELKEKYTALMEYYN